MILLQSISYGFPGGDVLFNSIHLSIQSHTKSAVAGSNGIGKSTLLKLIAGEIQPSEGSITIKGDLYYIPQMFGNFDHLTVSECLKIDKKLNAL